MYFCWGSFIEGWQLIYVPKKFMDQQIRLSEAAADNPSDFPDIHLHPPSSSPMTSVTTNKLSSRFPTSFAIATLSFTRTLYDSTNRRYRSPSVLSHRSIPHQFVSDFSSACPNAFLNEVIDI